MPVREGYSLRCLRGEPGSFFALVISGLAWIMMIASANGRPNSSFQTYPMEIIGVMDGDVAPDSREVAFVVQRVVSTKGSDTLTFFNDLQVWDFHKRSLTTQKTLWEGQAVLPRNPNPDIDLQRVLRYSHDGKSIIFSDGNIIHILNTSTYQEKNQFPLAPFPGPGGSWGSDILRVSPDDRKVAVYLADTVRFTSTIRIYDIGTGHLDRQFAPYVGVGSGGLAWSPDGTKLAFIWLPVHPGEDLPADARNARIVDVVSGDDVSSFNTGYVAGPIEFLSNAVVITASKNPDPDRFSDDTIKFWDVKTGRLLRRITNPDTGIRNALGVSSDGQRIMGYTGKERYNKLTHDHKILEQRFRIWDSETGKVLATSPTILPEEFVYGLQLQLSPKGDLVLVWGRNGKVLPTVYQISNL
jgi:WD40 repeat protein